MALKYLSGRWATVLHSCVRYELTYMSQVNNADGVRDTLHVTANVLSLSHVATFCFLGAV